jgi:hypothetical protein
MHTLGKTNWRLPAILDRRLPHLNLEDGAVPAGQESEGGREGTGELRPVSTT